MEGFLHCFENSVKKQWPTVTWLLLKHSGYCLTKPWFLLLIYQRSGSSQGAQLEVDTLHSPLDAIQKR